MFTSFSLYVFSPNNQDNENISKTYECFKTILADIILQLEEKSRNFLSEN